MFPFLYQQDSKKRNLYGKLKTLMQQPGDCSIVPGRRARRPGTIEQLQEAIRQEVAAIPPAMTLKTMDNFRERLQECVINNGRHLSDVIFKSI